MKPETKKTWEEVANGLYVATFLSLLNAEIERLKREIEDIYPELGRQQYRNRNIQKPWAVEQHEREIAIKDDEITRLSGLCAVIISELRKQVEARA